MSRFESPFFMKVSFYDQSKSDTNAKKNISHISYIGKRSGVDLGEVDLQEEISFEELDVSKDTAAHHVKYADERPGSHGLFDQDGVPSMKEVQNDLKNHDGIVWRMILSLKEEDALKLGFDNRDKWEDALRASVSNAANKIGIKESNLRWVAAFHQEQGHPHVHLVVWEKEPKRTKGVLSDGETKDVKRAFMREIYAEERARMNIEKTANRDLMRDLAKGDMQTFVQFLKQINQSAGDVERELRSVGQVQTGLAPKLFGKDEKELVRELNDLSKMLPTSGRIAFKFMPEDVKEKSLQLADKLLQNPAFQEPLNKYLKTTEEMALLYSNKQESIETAKNNAYNDLQKRIANLILRSAAESQRKNYLNVDEEVVEKYKKEFLNASGKPDFNLETEIIKKTVDILATYGMSEDEIKNTFHTWMPQIVVKKTSEEVNRIISNHYVNKDTKENHEWYSKFKDSIEITDNKLRLNEPDLYHKETFLIPKLITKAQIIDQLNKDFTQIVGDTKDITTQLNVALRVCGATFNERKNVLEDWAMRNEIDIDYKEINKESNKFQKLNKEDWESTLDGLNLKKDLFSWREEEKLNLDVDHLKEITKKAFEKAENGFKNMEQQKEFKDTILFSTLKQATNENFITRQIEKMNLFLPSQLQMNDTEKQTFIDFWKRNDIQQMKVFTDILTNAGVKRPQIFKLLGNVPKETQEMLSNSIRSLHVNIDKDTFISFPEFKKIKDTFQFYRYYPYHNDRVINIVEEDKKEIMQLFKNASLKEGANIQEVSKNMFAILRKVEIESSTAHQIVNSWAKKNNVYETEEFKNVDYNEKIFVGKPMFDETCNQLELGNIKLPWQNNSINNVKHEDLKKFVQDSIQEFSVKTVPKQSDRIEIRETLVKGIKKISSNEEEFIIKVNELMKKLPKNERLSQEEIEESAATLKRDDFNYVQRVLHVEDISQKTVEQYVVVLKSLGLDDVQTKEEIKNWCERSGFEMKENKFETVVQKSIDNFNENKNWGKIPFISKEQYETFTKDINVNVPYLWKSSFVNMNMLAKNIWKAINKAIEQEQAKTEAMSEMQRKQIEKQQARKANRHQQQQEEQER